jgi:hypothetical protein
MCSSRCGCQDNPAGSAPQSVDAARDAGKSRKRSCLTLWGPTLWVPLPSPVLPVEVAHPFAQNVQVHLQQPGWRARGWRQAGEREVAARPARAQPPPRMGAMRVAPRPHSQVRAPPPLTFTEFTSLYSEYLGVTTMTRWPRAARAAGREPMTSPSPPVLLQGCACGAARGRGRSLPRGRAWGAADTPEGCRLLACRLLAWRAGRAGAWRVARQAGDSSCPLPLYLSPGGLALPAPSTPLPPQTPQAARPAPPRTRTPGSSGGWGRAPPLLPPRRRRRWGRAPPRAPGSRALPLRGAGQRPRQDWWRARPLPPWQSRPARNSCDAAY